MKNRRFGRGCRLFRGIWDLNRGIIVILIVDLFCGMLVSIINIPTNDVKSGLVLILFDNLEDC
jgi:hypothetical protein